MKALFATVVPLLVVSSAQGVELEGYRIWDVRTALGSSLPQEMAVVQLDLNSEGALSAVRQIGGIDTSVVIKPREVIATSSNPFGYKLIPTGLPTPGATAVYAWSMNDLGELAGRVSGNFDQQGFSWRPSAEPKFTLFPGQSGSELVLFANNNAGLLGGSSLGKPIAVNQNNIVFLPPWSEMISGAGSVSAVDESNRPYGTLSISESGVVRPARWPSLSEEPELLFPSLGSGIPATATARLNAVNSSGTSVGHFLWATSPAFPQVLDGLEGYLWPQAGPVQYLGNYIPSDIANSGWSVGRLNPGQDAVVRTSSGQIKAVAPILVPGNPNYIWSGVVGAKINANGWIAGIGANRAIAGGDLRQNRPFIALPIFSLRNLRINVVGESMTSMNRLLGKSVSYSFSQEGIKLSGPQSGIQSLDSDGGAVGFTVQTRQRGQLDLYVRVQDSTLLGKISKVHVSLDSDSPVTVVLYNGDVDGDNIITIFDYIELSTAWDSSPADPHWNVKADLDADNAVTIFDYVILSQNFDKQGD